MCTNYKLFLSQENSLCWEIKNVCRVKKYFFNWALTGYILNQTNLNLNTRKLSENKTKLIARKHSMIAREKIKSARVGLIVVIYRCLCEDYWETIVLLPRYCASSNQIKNLLNLRYQILNVLYQFSDTYAQTLLVNQIWCTAYQNASLSYL